MTIWDLINYHPIAFEWHFWIIVGIIVLIIMFSKLESFSFKDMKMTFKRTEKENEYGFRLVNEIFFRKKIFSLPQEDFDYFFQECLYEHIYLTPYDYKHVCNLMNDTNNGPGNSPINIKKWSTNWNRQDYWDIDFRKIDKIVKKYRKMVLKYEKSIQKKSTK